MQLPDEAPKLPKLPFLIGDGVLVATAFVVAQRSESPLSTPALLAVVACVALGAVLAVIPFLVDYARHQDATLTERQNSLEALARTTSAAAEQIGVAASGLHTIAELVHKNLRAAEQLPHRLQEKINEFNQQRDEAVVAENEALAQEVNSLRSSEAEKLEAAATQVHRTVAELAKAEAGLQKHLAALREAVESLPAALDQAGARAGQSVVAAGDDVVARVLAEIDSHLAAAAGALAARASLGAGPPRSSPGSARRHAQPPPPVGTAAAVAAPETPAPPRDTPPAGEASRESGTSTPAPTPAATEDATPETAASTPPAPAVAPKVDEPAPPIGKAAAARKRPRKERSSESPDLPGFLVEEAPAPDTAVALADEDEAPAREGGELERSLSADGVTRLIVTAYIGIGNRLFVRGEGPGLSRDRGTPLQFVSIGKWRWENADATSPVRLRVLKNDQVECPGLGEIELAPGQQGEVTANF